MALIDILPGHAGPATHALVIGVGAYRHLADGPGPVDPRWPLGQLAGAATSASAFIGWLRTRFNNPAAPLATIEHLVTGREAATLGSEEPTMSAVEDAFGRWFARASADPANIALFFFSGHGVSKGVGTGLLLADFAAPNTPALMSRAIDVEATVTGMFSCKADRQLFIIDACRTPEVPLAQAMTRPGRELATASDADVRRIPQPILFATGLTQAAWQQVGQASPFTKALMKSLDGMGAIDRSGGYAPGQCEVDTNSLFIGTKHALALEQKKRFLPEQDVTPGSGSYFTLHYPREQIKVPFLIGCQPRGRNGEVELSVERDGAPFHVRAKPSPADLDLEVEPDVYRSIAVCGPDAKRFSKRGFIAPPFGEHRIDLSATG